MRQALPGVIVAAFFAGIAPTAEAQLADCRFTVQPHNVSVTPTGPEDLTARARIIPQPDSPVVITKVDFTGSTLDVSPGYFRWKPAYSLEVLNVSDKPIITVQTFVHVRSSSLSGVGNGWKWERTLAPGARAEIKAHGGVGRGGFSGDDVFVDILIESVTFDGCVYRPSQALRTTVASNR